MSIERNVRKFYLVVWNHSYHKDKFFCEKPSHVLSDFQANNDIIFPLAWSLAARKNDKRSSRLLDCKSHAMTIARGRWGMKRRKKKKRKKKLKKHRSRKEKKTEKKKKKKGETSSVSHVRFRRSAQCDSHEECRVDKDSGSFVLGQQRGRAATSTLK